MMRKVTVLFFLLSLTLLLPPPGQCESMEELLSSFQTEYDGLAPPPNSSVYGDFKLERVMIGSAYTIRSLKLIYEQNIRLTEKYDEMLLKYDEALGQNREIIDLLKVIAERSKKERE